MKREMIVFVAVYIVTAVGCALGAAALGREGSPDMAKQMAGMALLPLLVVPFIMAYVCNRMEGNTSGPFQGLTWGGSPGIWSAYGLGLLAGLLTVLACVGLGVMGIDLGMVDYIEMIKASSKQEIPAEAEKFLSIGGYSTLVAGPTIGAFFGALVACLATLPFYGWLGRRLLARGRGVMIGGLVLLTLATGWTQVMAPNPMAGDTPKWFLALSASLAGAASALAGSWFFLRFRSAYVPALFGATFNGMMAAAMVISSDANLMFAPPSGLATMLGMLVIGIALWVMKDPGGDDMAIAALAPDGTPISTQQLKAMQQAAADPALAPADHDPAQG